MTQLQPYPALPVSRFWPWLLARFLDPTEADIVLGDLEELCRQQLAAQGARSAASYYRTQVLRSLPGLVFRTRSDRARGVLALLAALAATIFAGTQLNHLVEWHAALVALGSLSLFVGWRRARPAMLTGYLALIAGIACAWYLRSLSSLAVGPALAFGMLGSIYGMLLYGLMPQQQRKPRAALANVVIALPVMCWVGAVLHLNLALFGGAELTMPRTLGAYAWPGLACVTVGTYFWTVRHRLNGAGERRGAQAVGAIFTLCLGVRILANADTSFTGSALLTLAPYLFGLAVSLQTPAQTDNAVAVAT